MFYYPTDPSEKYGVFAVRSGKYKAHYYTRGEENTHTHTHRDTETLSFSQRVLNSKPSLCQSLTNPQSPAVTVLHLPQHKLSKSNRLENTPLL